MPSFKVKMFQERLNVIETEITANSQEDALLLFKQKLVKNLFGDKKGFLVGMGFEAQEICNCGKIGQHLCMECPNFSD